MTVDVGDITSGTRCATFTPGWVPPPRSQAALVVAVGLLRDGSAFKAMLKPLQDTAWLELIGSHAFPETRASSSPTTAAR